MINYLTPLDYFFLVLISFVQIELWRISNGILKFLRFTMLYFLVQSLYLFIMMFSIHYRTSYYVLTIVECLIMAGLSIELGSSLVPKYRKFIQRAGPFVIAIPTFVIYEIINKEEIGQIIFIIKAIRIAELAFISSLSLLLFCIAFEDEESVIKYVARSYAILLVMLIICTEIQVRIGITTLVRTIWPLSWLIGLTGLYVTLRRCRNKGTFKISYS